MAQIIKHRRGTVAELANYSGLQKGELGVTTGSLAGLNTPVLHLGDGSGNEYPVGRLIIGASVPDISSYGQYNNMLFHDTDGQSLYRLHATGNDRLDLTGNIINRIMTGSLFVGAGYDVSGSYTSTGSFGTIRSVDPAGINITSIGTVSGSSTSTGSFGRIEAASLSAATIDLTGDITFDDVTASGNIITTGVNKVVSGSSTSTGSFGMGLFADRVGVGTTAPATIFHISSSGGLIIPDGTTAQRTSAATRGEIRFNTSLSTYEGYDGSNWGSLGGVIDVDQDTKITAETSAGADNDELQFTTAGTLQWTMGTDGSMTGSLGNNISGSSTSIGSFGSLRAGRNSSGASVFEAHGKSKLSTYYTDASHRVLALEGSNVQTGDFLQAFKSGGSATFTINAGGGMLASSVTASGHISSSGNLYVNSIRAIGDITAERFVVSSSVSHFTQSFSSGSTIFGDTIDDTHRFTGSLYIGTGSLQTVNHITASGNISGSSTSTGSFGELHIADKVGIGTTNPLYPLHVRTDESDYGAILGVTEGGSLGAIVAGSTAGYTHAFIGNFKYNFANPAASINLYTNAGEGIQMDGQTGLRFYATPDATVDASFQPAERMTILAESGNVGIGTTSPGVALEVIGSISGSSTSTGSFGAGYIDNKLGIGTAPNYKLDVLGSATSGVATPVHIVGGTGTSAGGFYLGAYSSVYGGLWSGAVTPASNNYALVANATRTVLNATGDIAFYIGDSTNPFYMNATGIGMGNANPATALDVTGTIQASGNISGSYTSTGSFGTLRAVDPAGINITAIGTVSGSATATGSFGHVMYTTAQGTVDGGVF